MNNSLILIRNEGRFKSSELISNYGSTVQGFENILKENATSFPLSKSFVAPRYIITICRNVFEDMLDMFRSPV